jgi:hypothetical protein
VIRKAGRGNSQATGIPTPFLLIFDTFFADCVRAENHVHTLLEQRGYRVSPNREFFSVPIPEAIRAVVDAERVLGDAGSENVAAVEIPGTDAPSAAWAEVFALAENAHYGLSSDLVDLREAVTRYEQAATLGRAKAVS